MRHHLFRDDEDTHSGVADDDDLYKVMTLMLHHPDLDHESIANTPPTAETVRECNQMLQSTSDNLVIADVQPDTSVIEGENTTQHPDSQQDEVKELRLLQRAMTRCNVC